MNTPPNDTTLECPQHCTPYRIFRLRKLPLRYAGIVMPLIVSILMSGLISLISTLRTLGLTPGLLSIWLNTWVIAWLVAFPSLMVILPLGRRITGLIVDMNINTKPQSRP